MNALREHLEDLLTDAVHGEWCVEGQCMCLIGQLRHVLGGGDPWGWPTRRLEAS